MAADSYIVRSLDIERSPQALSLVRLFDPEMTLEHWSEFARFYFHPGPGAEEREILTLESADGYIYGLAFCWLNPDLRMGRTLAVENFISAELGGGDRVATALMKAAEDHARIWNCNRICFSMIDPEECIHPKEFRNPTTEPFLKAGYSEANRYYCKNLDGD